MRDTGISSRLHHSIVGFAAFRPTVFASRLCLALSVTLSSFSRGRLEPPEFGVPRRPLITIVDDDESVREAIKGLIRSVGFAVHTYPSAKSFLTSSAVGNTTCLIADVTMPEMTGLELHRHVKAMGKQIPTILITAYPSDTGQEQALKSGALAYLPKPFSDHDLLDCIRSALGSS